MPIHTHRPRPEEVEEMAGDREENVLGSTLRRSWSTKSSASSHSPEIDSFIANAEGVDPTRLQVVGYLVHIVISYNIRF